MHSGYLTCLLTFYLTLSWAYSPSEDARTIAAYKLSLKQTKQGELDHASIARKLVHQTDWVSMGTISSVDVIKDFPMVNVISINDNDVTGHSTGHIQFLLTDLDFSGKDWQHNNKVSVLLTDEQQLHCTRNWFQPIDPMEPTCARAVISGEIKKFDKNSTEYDQNLIAFVQRHSSAVNWIKAHNFYLCELVIKNIFVLDSYGGPHTVKPDDYYNAKI